MGKLAKLAGISIRTLRYYDKTKLIERAKYN
ncbi:MAG: MerR family DNA-binding transcriptional regulator [Balneola sp.]